MTLKKGRQEQPATIAQDAPTAARPVDANGREIDQWGLPINGPARVRALAELGKPDPHFAPEAWVSASAESAAVTEADKVTGAENG